MEKNNSSNQALFYKVARISKSASYTFGLSASSRFAITINVYSKLITTSGVTGVIDSIGFSVSTGKHSFAVALKPL